MKEEVGDHVSGWASILGDILRCIGDMTHSVQDRVRMFAVCRSWQAIDIKINKKIKSHVCLMLAESEKSNKCCFYNISEETFVELDLPEIRGRRCLGTPFGWLVTCSLDLEIQLFHPLSRANLPLPPSTRTFTHHLEHLPPLLIDESSSGDEDYPERMCKFLVRKFILSSNPADSDCIVLALFTHHVLAFAMPGSKAWTPIDYTRPVEDAIYFKGNFYACKQRGRIFSCEDIDGSHPKAVKFVPPPPSAPIATQKYLFDLGGNLCLVSRGLVRYMELEDGKSIEEFEEENDDDEKIDMRLRYSSFEFMIFMLDMHTKSWKKIYSLGDSSLFLGNCCTFVIEATDYSCCKSNCIYFTGDNLPFVHDSTKGRGIDMGIYNCRNLELDLDDEELDLDGIVEPFPKLKEVPHLLWSSLSPPLWIIPYAG